MMRLPLMVMIVASSLAASGCLLESVKPLAKYRTPSLAYYVKPNMTREDRLKDLAACGNTCGIRGPCFTKEAEEEAEKIAKATGEFHTGPGINDSGYLVLLRRLPACMASKGYHALPLDACIGNDLKDMEPCMYP